MAFITLSSSACFQRTKWPPSGKSEYNSRRPTGHPVNKVGVSGRYTSRPVHPMADELFVPLYMSAEAGQRRTAGSVQSQRSGVVPSLCTRRSQMNRKNLLNRKNLFVGILAA